MARVGDAVRQILSRRDVADAQRALLASGLAQAPGHARAVARDDPPVDGRRAVGRQGGGIDEHAVGPVEAVAHTQHSLLLGALAAHVEVATHARRGLARDRRADVTHRQQRSRPLAQPYTSRQAIEPLARQGGLGLVPGAHLGRLAVLEPSVRIGHGDAVQDLDQRFFARRDHGATECTRRQPGRYWSMSLAMRPLVLLSNDDGHSSAGLRAMRDALAQVADVVALAPESEQSASSHALSLHRSLRLRAVEPGLFALDGTPADCVYVALHAGTRVLPRRPDLIVSGINHGMNLGQDAFYSGTVAAAREGALRGIPAVATSAHGAADLQETAKLCVDIGLRLLQALAAPEGAGVAAGKGVLLNVNVPKRWTGEIRATRLGARIYEEVVDFRRDPRGREYLWLGGPGVRHERDRGHGHRRLRRRRRVDHAARARSDRYAPAGRDEPAGRRPHPPQELTHGLRRSAPPARLPRRRPPRRRRRCEPRRPCPRRSRGPCRASSTAARSSATCPTSPGPGSTSRTSHPCSPARAPCTSYSTGSPSGSSASTSTSSSASRRAASSSAVRSPPGSTRASCPCASPASCPHRSTAWR